MYNIDEYNALNMVFSRVCVITNERIDGMKKLSMRVLSAALSLILASGCILTATAFEGRYGDADGNGQVNSTDALAVLMHTVEKKKLQGDALLRSDVDANTEINATDALQILQFTVGKITEFKAETIAPPEESEQDALNLYTAAVDKLYTDIPSYVLKNKTEPVKVDMSGKLVDMLGPEELESLKEAAAGTTSNNSLFKKGTPGAQANLPRKIDTADATKFAGVDFELLETGEYKVVIRFRDEVNPTKDSVLVKTLGLKDAQTVKNETAADMNELASKFGGVMTVKSGDVKYTNASVTCVVNPETYEFSEYLVSCDLSMFVGLSVRGIFTEYDINIDMTMRMTNGYSHFEYPTA